MEHFADRLTTRLDETGSPVCVGIDPVYERLPSSLRKGKDPQNAHDAVATIQKFVMGVFDAITPHIACVKIQSACFERYLWPGVEAYHRLVHQARTQGLIVIGDAKRGDIQISAAHYAAGCLGDPSFNDLGPLHGPDAITINPYLGGDGITPFLDLATPQHKGVFALVRTSNPSGDAVQNLPLAEGGTVAQAVARIVAQLGDHPNKIGRCGYSLLGAVVGATKTDDITELRRLMPRQIFLVPGFGAQGGSAQGVKACFKPDGTGAIVTASRSVIYAYETTTGNDWKQAVAQAARTLKEQIAQALR